MMFSGRAEPGVDLRLHQCVVDLEGRPDRALRLPPAEPHESADGHDVAIARRDPTVEARPFIDFSSATCSARRDLAEAGRAQAWRLYQNYGCSTF
jgi:hypothetical protein